MNQNKIAILVDSGCDVPPDFVAEHNIFVAPLKIIYKDREYEDRLDITPQQVYARLDQEVPKTSLPSTERVNSLFEAIHGQGYEELLIITISTGLSGTHNLLAMLAQQFGKLRYHMVDTRNIGIGAGQQAMMAAQMLRDGAPLEEVLRELETSIARSRIFFYLDTLEYLAKGGRIGKVSALVGSLLKLRPIISCNKDGIYETVEKVRGSAQALAKAISLVVTEAGKHVRFAVAVAHGSAKDEAARVMAELKRRLPHCERFISTDVSPALSVHTGPGLIGIAVQALPAK
ncbi:MAG: DegV family protein [Clostridiales bacterium]|nr:DegV family protein [Clostridiales bacterium]